MRRRLISGATSLIECIGSVPSDFLLLPIPPLEIVPTFSYQAQSLANGNSTTAATYLEYIGTLTQQYNDVRNCPSAGGHHTDPCYLDRVSQTPSRALGSKGSRVAG